MSIDKKLYELKIDILKSEIPLNQKNKLANQIHEIEMLKNSNKVITDKPFEIGDKISKNKGYAFEGEIVAVFKNTKGQVRIVAEHYGSQTEESGGMLHIFSETQLTKNN